LGRDESVLSGDPPDSQHQPPLSSLKSLFYYDDKNTLPEKTRSPNKAVDLKTTLRYRWNYQNRAFARKFAALLTFSDITFPTRDLPHHHISQFVAQQRLNADSRKQNPNPPLSSQKQF
jgi:hypothetical protein